MSQALISQILIGVSVAAILAISAIGLAVIFGVAGVINMAHGQFIMVGAYTAAVVGQLGGNTFIAIPIAFIVVALVGLVVERGVIQFLYERPLETLLATWGVGIILEVIMKAIFGPELYYVGAPRILDGGLRIIGRLPYPYYRLFLIGCAIAMIAATFLLIYKTNFGLKVRAVRRNRAMSGCLGIDTARVDMLIFMYGSGLGRHRRRDPGTDQVGLDDDGFHLCGRLLHGHSARWRRKPARRADWRLPHRPGRDIDRV